jgi:phosphoglycolate phosphatase
MKYQTLIFDLDGTISDPSEGIVNCVNHGLDVCGLPPAEPDDIRRLIGPPLTEIFETLTGDKRESVALRFVSAYRDRYSVSGYRENIIYPEMPDVIRKLAATGAVLGVCTSKRADYAEKIIDMFGLLPFFRFIDGGDIHIKKYTQLEKLVRAGIDAPTAMMIGDRAVDIEAARTNAIASVGVCWGFGDKEEIDGACPDHIAGSPGDLLEILG